jgi:hypothetical protein
MIPEIRGNPLGDVGGGGKEKEDLVPSREKALTLHTADAVWSVKN